MMSSLSLIMVHIAPCFQELCYGPLFMKIHRFKRCRLSKLNSFDQIFMKLGHIVKYYDVFYMFDNGLSHYAFRNYGPLFTKIHRFH